MPRRFGFGLGFSLSRLSGIPREPSGFVAKLTSYILGNFTLDGSDVTQWDDESDNANNVTQAVTANKFTLVQDANPFNNVVRSDAVDDNMTPLPTTTGDFAMQFKKKANTLATTKVLFSSSTTSAEVRLNTSNQFEVVSDAGTVFTFPITFATTQQEVNIVRREGDYIYVHGSNSYAELAYVAGEAFTFDRISDTANASDSDWQEIRIYDNGLTADEVNYFYYLRNTNNEILTPPLLPDAGNEFIFSVKTDNAGGVSANNQMKIGTISTGVYDCTVDWGDGNSDVITSWNDPAWTHTYSVAGTYLITISGTSFTYPYFFGGDDTKVLNVSKWGLTNYGTTGANSFNGCSNLTLSSSDIPDTSSVTGTQSTWRDCSSLTEFPLIDTSSVTNMNLTWYGCSSLISFPLINTSSATSISSTWRDCTSLTSVPLIDTSSVTGMNNAWQNCSSLTSFPLISTSLVTNMSNAWSGCSSLTDFPLIDVSSCTNFANTWLNCALNSASIDNIMQALVNGNQNNLSTDISGGTNLGFASWSAGAVANYNTLISRGWTITTNP